MRRAADRAWIDALELPSWAEIKMLVEAKKKQKQSPKKKSKKKQQSKKKKSILRTSPALQFKGSSRFEARDRFEVLAMMMGDRRAIAAAASPKSAGKASPPRRRRRRRLSFANKACWTSNDCDAAKVCRGAHKRKTSFMGKVLPAGRGSCHDPAKVHATHSKSSYDRRRVRRR